MIAVTNVAGIGSGYGGLWKVAFKLTGTGSWDTPCWVLFISKPWILPYMELSVLAFSIKWLSFSFVTYIVGHVLLALDCVCPLFFWVLFVFFWPTFDDRFTSIRSLILFFECFLKYSTNLCNSSLYFATATVYKQILYDLNLRHWPSQSYFPFLWYMTVCGEDGFEADATKKLLGVSVSPGLVLMLSVE